MRPRFLAVIAASAACTMLAGSPPATAGPACSAGAGSAEWTETLREDAETLARRIRHRESASPFPDAGRTRELAGELESVLCRIKTTHPDLAPIPPRERVAPGEILISLGPDLMRAVSAFPQGEVAGSAPLTGNPAFDRLNREFGLLAAQTYPEAGLAVLAFPDVLNIQAAIRHYIRVPGVFGAEPNRIVGDGPDIAAAMRDGSWHVVFRSARGDCPAGCIHSELHYLVVDGEAVSRIPPSSAERMREFRGIGGEWRR